MHLLASLATVGNDVLSTEHYATDSITLQTQPVISPWCVCGLPNSMKVSLHHCMIFHDYVSQISGSTWQTMPGSETAGPPTSPYLKLLTTCHDSSTNRHFRWHHSSQPKCWHMWRLQQGAVMPLKKHVYKVHWSCEINTTTWELWCKVQSKTLVWNGSWEPGNNLLHKIDAHVMK